MQLGHIAIQHRPPASTVRRATSRLLVRLKKPGRLRTSKTPLIGAICGPKNAGIKSEFGARRVDEIASKFMLNGWFRKRINIGYYINKRYPIIKPKWPPQTRWTGHQARPNLWWRDGSLDGLGVGLINFLFSLFYWGKYIVLDEVGKARGWSLT